MSAGMKLIGDKDLIKQLENLADRKTAKRVTKKAVNAGATPIVAAMRSNVRVKSGLTKKAITKKVAAKKNGFGFVAVMGVDMKIQGQYPPTKTGKNAGKPRRHVPANIDHLIEFGFFNKQTKTHVPPHSFIRAGFEQGAGAAGAAMESKLKDEIEKEAMNKNGGGDGGGDE